jgi:hypothetical protein
MKELIRNLLRENLQQAEKIYFKNGVLSPEDKDFVLSITNGDPYTRLVADWVYHLRHIWNQKLDEREVNQLVKPFYQWLKTYDKNVFPVVGDLQSYNAQTNSRGDHILDLWSMLKNREFAIEKLKELPSIAVRNLKNIIRTPNNSEYGFKEIGEKLAELARTISNFPQPSRYDDEETTQRKNSKREAILKKVFNSKHTLQQMVDTANNFSMGFNSGAEEIGKQEVIKTCRENNADIIQNKGDLLVIRVNDQETMSVIGCTSLWCFSRPHNESDWEAYAPNGFAFVIFDFTREYDDALFMMTYLDDGRLYTSTNVPVEDVGIDGDEHLRALGVDTNKLTGKKERRRREPIEAAEKPKQRDPNQLELAFETRKIILKKLALLK